ncbi:MAG: hypothetical protein RR868_09075, partial [Muribaculaceae bacterium]
ATSDYAMVLKVFNEKSMLPESNVAQLCGLNTKDEYIKAILNILKGNGRDAIAIRRAIKRCFGISDNDITNNE